MFSKLLLANRGEIAVRVARTCRDLGVRVVAVYSDADRNAPYLDWADEAYALGGRLPSETYLDIGKLLEVARRSGAQAVHPGYGFLAEHPGFAAACIEEGLVFVGPSPRAIELMGDKVVSRRLARDAGVPLVPGTGPINTAGDALRFAAEHGYPLAIKAAAGGGGRGLRIVHRESEVIAALEAARREGQFYFGNPTVYVERFLDDPKHVEIQLVGTCTGEVLALGERDCSVQRRHQKLIEETPGPTVSPEIRERLESAAIRLAEAVGYRGAGTVEFLLEPGGQFYFLEMNTRIQVEHPVTEVVRSCDLVAMQLGIAAGEPVEMPGEARGHALECRINAEDVAAGFRPVTGKLAELREPSGPGVRVDSGVRAGYVVPPEYDSLLAKLVVWGGSREEARTRMLRALREYMVEGVPTTIPAHERVLRHEEFIAGSVGTAFLEREHDALFGDLAPYPLTHLTAHEEEQARRTVVEVNGRRYEVALYEQPGASSASSRRPKPSLHRAGGRGAARGPTLVSPLQGSVARVAVRDGDAVRKGDLVCVLEAMKMENELHAHKDGTVANVRVQVGESVSVGSPLLDIV
ncbi:MAG: biotin/lipoyl-binding protein [Chloroflexota bacterium]|nr:biotin/lipoyl-binding protein [Chloroflexota bacterium]